jgi:hypothetical protein
MKKKKFIKKVLCKEKIFEKKNFEKKNLLCVPETPKIRICAGP